MHAAEEIVYLKVQNLNQSWSTRKLKGFSKVHHELRMTMASQDWEEKHIPTAYRHPESNGQIEVANKILKYEYVGMGAFLLYLNILLADGNQDILMI